MELRQSGRMGKGTGEWKEQSDRELVKPGVPTRRWQTGFGPTRSHMSTKSARMRRRERGFGPPHGHRGEFKTERPPFLGGFLIQGLPISGAFQSLREIPNQSYLRR